jgi:hypothetical protein
MTTELATRVEPLLPMDPEQARGAMAQYQALTAAMLTDRDWQVIPSGKFVKRSGWSKIATGYGLSTEVLALEIDRDEDGQPIRAHARVRATHPTGRFEENSGGCAITEQRFRTAGGRAKAEHDIPATAVTRAKNRAIADLVGFGAVSAEEMDMPPADGTPEGDAKVADIVSELYPEVDGRQFVELFLSTLGVAHVPDAACRMIAAVQWALRTERLRPTSDARAPENAPPVDSAYQGEATP